MHVGSGSSPDPTWPCWPASKTGWLTLRALAIGSEHLGVLGLVALLIAPLGVLFGHGAQVVGHRVGVGDARHHPRHLSTSARRERVSSSQRQPAGPADVTLRRVGGERRHGGVDALRFEQLRDRPRRGDAERDVAGPGANGGQQVLDARRTQDPHRARCGFLDRLQQCVGGRLGHAVRIPTTMTRQGGHGRPGGGHDQRLWSAPCRGTAWWNEPR